MTKVNSRSLFPGSGSTVGRGKDGFARDYFKKIEREAQRKEMELEKLRALYHGVPLPQKIRKPRVYKKKEVIDPAVLAKISAINVEEVEKALKGYLAQKLNSIVLDIGENGKMVTLASVLKTINSVKEKEQIKQACVATADPLPIDGVWQNEEI